MTSYEITSDLAGWSFKRKAARTLLMAGLFTVLLIGFRLLSPYHRLHAIDLIAAAAALAMAGASPFNKSNLRYKLVVSDDSITAVYPSFKRSIERNRVKTLIESRGTAFTPPALRVSQHGRFGMCLWGGVSIPRALPQYESLRALALARRADGFYASRR